MSMTKTKIVDTKDVKCFNIISKQTDRKFGEECGRLLLKKNSIGKVEGEIKCNRCSALYDIRNGKIYLIERGK